MSLRARLVEMQVSQLGERGNLIIEWEIASGSRPRNDIKNP